MSEQSLVRVRHRDVQVVDDDGRIREFLRQIITANCYTVLAAPGGREALDLLRRHGSYIGLAQIDVLMPVADGPAVLVTLRRRQPDLPACFITSYAAGYSEAELLAFGVAAVLSTPFGIQELLKLVGRILH